MRTFGEVPSSDLEAIAALSSRSAESGARDRATIAHGDGVTKPHLVFYAPSFNALGGGEVWLNRIANGLAERGWGVTVVGKRPPRVPVAHRWHRTIDLVYLDSAVPAPVSPSVRSRVVSAASDTRFATSVRDLVDALMRGWRPEGAFTQDLSAAGHLRLAEAIARIQAADDRESNVLVICTDVYTGSHLAAAVAAGRILAPFYVMHHNSFASLNAGTSRAYREAAKGARALVALTEEDAALFRKSGVPRVVAMANPRPERSSDQESIVSNSKVVTWMARMTKVKAGDVAIRAWSRISSEFPEWRLDLWGDGPERPRLEALVRRLGVSSSVHFRGVTDSPDDVFKRSAINLLTSRFEGWALVIGEAALRRVPTVAADNSPGVRAQIQDGTDGILVPVGDVQATATRLAGLMRDQSLRERMGMLAETRSAEFDLFGVLDDWERLLLAPPEQVGLSASCGRGDLR